MSAPLIYSGRRAKMLTQDGILRADGSIIDNNGTPNLIKNGHAEINVTGWTVSKNTVAASRPDSGFVTSSTNITWTRNTTNPIDGQADFLYTKDAANRQGQQVYCGFTVAKKHRAKVLQIEVDYLVNSGTFSAGSSSTDSDVILYIYDVTNSTFIEPSSFKLLSNSSTIADKFIANFQTSATGSSYRILFHQATTSSSAFAVQFKDVRVSPCQYVYGTPISDWVSYTPTGSLTTNTTYTGMRRRVGGDEEFRIKTAFSGTNTQGAMTLNLPVTIDTAKIPGTISGATIFGQGSARDIGSADFDVVVGYNSTTSVTVLLKNSSATYAYFAQVDTSANVPMTIANGDTVEVFFKVPVVGYSSSTQVSDGYDGREISLRATVNGSTTLAASGDTLIPYALGNGVTYDKVNCLSSSICTVPSSGRYRVSAKLFITGGQSWTNGDVVTLYAKVDNTTYYPLGSFTAQATQTLSNAFTVGGTVTLDLTAGQTIRIVSNNVLAATKSNQASVPNYNSLEIEKLQAPTTISATERVSFSVNTSTSSVSTSSPFIFTNVVENSHGAYSTSTGVFTAPKQGFYFFTATYYTGATATQGVLYKNGSTQVAQGISTVSSAQVGNVSYGLTLNAGETIELRAITSATASGGAILNNFTGFLVK